MTHYRKASQVWHPACFSIWSEDALKAGSESKRPIGDGTREGESSSPGTEMKELKGRVHKISVEVYGVPLDRFRRTRPFILESLGIPGIIGDYGGFPKGAAVTAVQIPWSHRTVSLVAGPGSFHI